MSAEEFSLHTGEEVSDDTACPGSECGRGGTGDHPSLQTCAWSFVSCVGRRMSVGLPCWASTGWMSAAAPWGPRGAPHARRALSLSLRLSPACVPGGWALPAGTSCQAVPFIKVRLGSPTGQRAERGQRPGGGKQI